MVRFGILVLFVFLGIGVYLQFGVLVLYGLFAVLLLLMDVQGFGKSTVMQDIKTTVPEAKKS